MGDGARKVFSDHAFLRIIRLFDGFFLMSPILFLGPVVALLTGVILLVLLFTAYSATNYGGLLVLVGASGLDILSALASMAFNYSVYGAGAAANAHPMSYYRLFGGVQLGLRGLALGLTVLGMGLLLQEFVKLTRERRKDLPTAE